MIRWNGLNVTPGTSQMLREVDPEFFVGLKRSTVVWENSRR
jgi:hypothetical protein